MNKKYKFILMLLIVLFAISSYFFIKEIAENKKENNIYEDLQEIVKNEENSIQENDYTNASEDKSDNISTENNTNPDDFYNLENISKINTDVIGWIKINGTNINYPIMQNENYYLHRNIYKKYSSHGTPYLAEYCNLRTSNNLIIYGHHMNDNSMFAELVNYKNYNYYKNHKYIYFYTLRDGQTIIDYLPYGWLCRILIYGQTIKNTYEIVTAFKTIAYSDNGFKYYNYTNFYNEQEFNSFIENCRNLEFYNTDVNLKYGDKLITLSTCEYSQKNGRMVIIAKKI